MTKNDVLEQLNLATIQEAIDISFTEPEDGENLLVVKKIDGEGMTETPFAVVSGYKDLSYEDKNFVRGGFNSTNNVMSGRPCK